MRRYHHHLNHVTLTPDFENRVHVYSLHIYMPKNAEVSYETGAVHPQSATLPCLSFPQILRIHVEIETL